MLRQPRVEFARRARNPIRVLPIAAAAASFDEVYVIGTGAGSGEPLRRADPRGTRQLVLLGDLDAVDVSLATRVHRVHVEVESGVHPFRLVASIALAEIARQLG